MTVAFPDGYNLDRSSRIERDNNTAVDIMDDGTTHIRVLGPDSHTTINALFSFLTRSEKDSLVDFLKTNRANEITWTVDGIAYSGHVVSTIQEDMVGILFNVAFTYRGRDV